MLIFKHRQPEPEPEPDPRAPVIWWRLALWLAAAGIAGWLILLKLWR